MTGAAFRRVSGCRGCGSPDLADVVSLGDTPLANSLLPSADAEAPRYPLTIIRCRACSLVQLREVIPPEHLFSDYVYFSSFSETLLRHSAATVAELAESEQLGRDSLVVEIASNDGYLLQYFKQRGVPVLGIEPAQNIARVAQTEKGIPTIARFFGAELAEELASQGHLADVVLGNNVLAHVPDLNGFVRGVARILKPSGMAAFEVPYLKDMLDHVEFDTAYHEHQCYYSLTALAHLFCSNGLDVFDVRRLPIHGGSIRVYVAPKGTRARAPAATQLLADEREWGVGSDAPYARFAGAVQSVKSELVALIRDLRDKGHSVAAYGAAAKGVTLCAYCGIGRGDLDFVVDRSTYKQGRFFPVGGLPILPTEQLLARRPDYTLLLTWNFAAEILRQQADYRSAGGVFIVPVPRPTLVAP